MKKSRLNTWEELFELRKELLENHKKPENDRKLVMTWMEETWKEISHNDEWREVNDNIGASPLESMLELIRTGQPVPPEYLFLLSELFREYFEAKGEKEIEEVLFGKRVPRAGNYAARRQKSEKDNDLAIALHFANEDGFSKNDFITAIAGSEYAEGASEDALKKRIDRAGIKVTTKNPRDK